jgi:hypothetical protein
VKQLRNPPLYGTEPPNPSEPTLCRIPTAAMLAKLPPIPLQNRLSTCVFGGSSLSRFNSNASLASAGPIDTSKVEPIVLGSHVRKTLPYQGAVGKH